MKNNDDFFGDEDNTPQRITLNEIEVRREQIENQGYQEGLVKTL